MSDQEVVRPKNFIRQIVEQDLAEGKHQGIVTRFPPEPNGYLHIGHAKAICLNFGLAQDFDAVCNLRFDDTNPEKESQEYVSAITRDVSWLGFEWGGDIRYASLYFDTLYELAVQLVKDGHAYVCDLSPDEAREYRGTLKTGGKNSPFRDRTVEENLELLTRMKDGEFDEGSCVLRAKIDMSAPNINMRDPILYRIRNVVHHQTGDKWCIYPMYDFTHPVSDAIEGITHSLCTLEFEAHRPLYNWVIEHVDLPAAPRQIEFARLNLNYTITSKRKLKQLVDEKIVDGWNDPRLPTISGMRRRGYTPESLRTFCEMIGVTRSEGVVDMSMLEHAVRDDLNQVAARRMCVLKPLKLVITNYPEEQVERLSVPNHPQQESMGYREVPFSREVWIDQEDFRIEANNKFKRLVLNKEVRLRYGYVVLANDVLYNEDGSIKEVHATYDPDTLGKSPEGRKVKGVIHWVSVQENVPCEVRLYDRLFNDPTPDAHEESFLSFVNESSCNVITTAYGECALRGALPETRYQFEREGYFCIDPDSEGSARLVVNRTVGLRDSWAKIEQK